MWDTTANYFNDWVTGYKIYLYLKIYSFKNLNEMVLVFFIYNIFIIDIFTSNNKSAGPVVSAL